MLNRKTVLAATKLGLGTTALLAAASAWRSFR
jgi:hypothetical protein